jgi:hypothetical protein
MRIGAMGRAIIALNAPVSVVLGAAALMWGERGTWLHKMFDRIIARGSIRRILICWETHEAQWHRIHPFLLAVRDPPRALAKIEEARSCGHQPETRQFDVSGVRGRTPRLGRSPSP